MGTVAVLVETRYLAHLQPAGLIRELKLRGHEVHVVDAANTTYSAGDTGWLADLDVVVARGRSWGLLAMLGGAEAFGVPTVNSRAAIAAVHNKADMAVRLASARVAIPRTWFGTIDQLALRIPETEYPVILKPVFGDNARGLQIVRSTGELRGVATSEVLIGQQYIANDGFDLKLYAVGSEVWAVRKPSPLHASDLTPPEHIAVTREMRDLARRCGRLFGLQLYGVDCIATARGLAVIEVNEYPNYTGVLEADDRIARCVEQFLHAGRNVAAV